MTHPASRHEAPCCGNCSQWEGDEASDRAGCRVKRDILWRDEWCPSYEVDAPTATQEAGAQWCGSWSRLPPHSEPT